jgi:hypothetical protein
MAEFGQGPRSGARDNGLRCAGYVAIGDVDPRVANVLLDRLRDEGIAAYVTPTPASQGGALELRLPHRPTDRLFADVQFSERASLLFSAEHEAPAAHASGPIEDATPEPDPIAVPGQPDAEIDFDAAWQQVLGSLQSGGTAQTRPWPASEDVVAATPAPHGLDVDDYDAELTNDPAVDEHFEPPPPPPLPRLRKVTIIGWLTILGGILLIVSGLDGGALVWLGALAILAGTATLIWHLKDGPPIDSGWDDGAVL